MDKTRCWKCNEVLVNQGCPVCDEDFVYLAKKAIDNAKKRANNIDGALASFKKKIEKYRSGASDFPILALSKNTKDIGYAINNLCNTIDLLNQGNSHLISEDDLLEVQQKAQEMITCAQKLLDIKSSD
jgi:hypothetical protein